MSRVPALALIAAAVAACGSVSTAAPARTSAATRVIPAASVQREVAGKPAVYLFTSTGCSSCVAAVRAMQSAARDHGGVRFIAVDMFGTDASADISAWLQANDLDSTMVVWTIDKDGTLMRKFGVTSLETSVLVDSSGQVRFVNQGGTDPAVLAKQLQLV